MFIYGQLEFKKKHQFIDLHILLQLWYFFWHPTICLKTYFRTAWRGIVRNKVYSSLNIFGLAIGMAVALLIGLWIYYQCSFDRFTPGYARAYQVKYNFSDDGAVKTSPEIAIPLANALKNDVPEIDRVALAFGPRQLWQQLQYFASGRQKDLPCCTDRPPTISLRSSSCPCSKAAPTMPLAIAMTLY